jgi:hypothetical protein
VACACEREMSVGIGVHVNRTGEGGSIFPAVGKDYSRTPLPTKLGVTAASRVAIVNGPDGFAERIGVEPTRRGILDVAILFETRRGELTRQFTPLARRLAPAGGLWIAWPKKGAGLESDLSFESVQEIGLRAGLVDNKSCSIDDTWQALRFVVRVADRQPASSSRRSA